MPSPTTTPIPTRTEPTIDPAPSREREMDPAKLCPAQKVTITRRLAPLLP